MPPQGLRRKLAAILSADVREYSRLMREDETATIRALTEYRDLMATLVKQHHGRVVDAVGDNVLAEFASVVDAVRISEDSILIFALFLFSSRFPRPQFPAEQVFQLRHKRCVAQGETCSFLLADAVRFCRRKSSPKKAAIHR